jgi:hypothetical protein
MISAKFHGTGSSSKIFRMTVSPVFSPAPASRVSAWRLSVESRNLKKHA